MMETLKEKAQPEFMLASTQFVDLMREVMEEDKRWHEELFSKRGLHSLFFGWPEK